MGSSVITEGRKMKVLVVHPAQQHSYRMATALKKSGCLYKYITTVYCKKGSYTEKISHLLKGNYKKKAQLRVCEDLLDEEIVQFCELEGLLKLFVMNISFFRPFYRKIKYHTADRFAKRVVQYAIKNGIDAVVGYDDASSVLFKLLETKAPDILRIMDVSAANTLYMRQIYEKDMKIQPDFAEHLLKERKIVWDRNTIERTRCELTYGQIFIVPSKFVARSLEYSGVSQSSIRICPYGVDTNKFSQKSYYNLKNMTRPIRFIYVGGVKELKGISYLLEAINSFPSEQATLTVVGSYSEVEGALKPYLDRVEFTGSILHEEVSKKLMESDVYVFPSLGEGLSLSTLEAASCGLPLIVSENSGVNDAMTEGKEGFVIPIQSTQAIIEKMNWFIQNPNCIETMGQAARKMALQYTWDSYYSRMGKIFEEIEKKDLSNGANC